MVLLFILQMQFISFPNLWIKCHDFFFPPKENIFNAHLLSTSNLSINVRSKPSVFAFQTPFFRSPLLFGISNFVLVLWGPDKLQEYLSQIINKCWSSGAQREYTFQHLG